MAEHALFSPSHAATWSNCTASHDLEQAAGVEDRSSPAAEEGTLAHAVLEKCLSLGGNPENYIDGLDLEEGDKIEMIEGVQLAIDYVNQRLQEHPDAYVLVEQRVTLNEDCWGTADIIIVKPHNSAEGIQPNGWFEVIDFKYGKGVFVSIVGNRQLILYALAAGSDPRFANMIRSKITIIQPRIPNPAGLIRSENLSVEEWHFWYTLFMDAFERIKNNPTFEPCEQACRWCRAKSVCKALHDKSLQDAKAWFADIEPEPTLETIEMHATRSPGELTMEEMTVVLGNVELIRAWLKAVEARALEWALEGKEIPGFKVVEGTGGRRKWDLDEEAMIKKLVNMGFTKSEITKETLLGPAPVEKLVKKKKFSDRKVKNFEAHIVKPKGKMTLVPEADARAAIPLNATDMFKEVTPS